MTNSTEALKPYWVSWYAHHGNAFEWPGPWWFSGSTTVCAAVMATSEDHARRLIQECHDDKSIVLEWRFANPRDDDWSPFSERFERADWMKWPWPA